MGGVGGKCRKRLESELIACCDYDAERTGLCVTCRAAGGRKSTFIGGSHLARPEKKPGCPRR